MSWERSLKHIDRLLESAGRARGRSQRGPAPSRVVWRLQAGGAWLVLHAYEQRLQKDGSYSKGRKATPERLKESPALWTRPDVEEVARAAYWEDIGDGYYREIKWDYHLDQALPALVGCEHVSWLDDPSRKVEVCAGSLALRLSPGPEGELMLTATLDGDSLSAKPEAWVLEQAVVRVEPEQDRVRVARCSGALCDWLGEFEEGVTFPASARQALLERLEPLRELVTVEVDPALEGEPTEADDRIRFLVEPLEGGLRVRARIRPDGSEVVYAPGEGPADFPGFVEGEWVTVWRDLDYEADLFDELVAELGLEGEQPWELKGEAALDWVGATQEEDERFVVEWPEGVPLRVSRPIAPTDFKLTLTDRRDWFGVEGGISVDGWDVPLELLLASLRSGERYVALDGGRWVQISAQLRQQLTTLARATRTSGQGRRLDRALAPQVEPILREFGEVEADAAWEELRKRLKAAKRVSTHPPKGLNATLRPYQQEGFAWLKRLATWGAGACLADDMGLGKTVQAIAVLVARQRLGPALVVAPTSVGGNWIRELEAFAPGLNAISFREQRDLDMESLGARDVVVISYDLARIEIERLRQVGWASLVFDEAQQVKNAASKTARALRELEADWRVALTGTPLENHLGELWSLFRLISPGVLGTWDHFKATYGTPIQRDGDDAAREALAELIQPFVLRRTKAEVLTDLPGRTDVQVQVELSRREQQRYERARLEALAALLKEDREDKRFQVLAALTKLRQLACHPKLVDGAYRGRSSKLESLLELVEELREGEHRALVFSQFTRHLGLVRKELDARKISYQYLDGSTPAKARQQRVDAFQAGEGELFLISLKAGGKGLNLTGADYVIHLDPWWNPAVEDQATDRAHRIGQTKAVTVYRLVAVGTIEEEILALHEAKRDLVAGVLAGTDRAGALSTEELMDLIRGRA